jgi:hypothetical protein
MVDAIVGALGHLGKRVLAGLLLCWAALVVMSQALARSATVVCANKCSS